MKVLIDTCVVIDLLQNRVPFSDDAKKIFYLVGDKKIDGCITANSCTDIYYITRKALHDTNAAKEVMKKLFKLVTILDTTGKSCIDAIISDIKDYEDAVMVNTAMDNGIDCIITRNIRDYQNISIPVCDSKDFTIN